MKYSIKLKSIPFVNTELLRDEDRNIPNDWKHELVLTPIIDYKSEEEEDNEEEEEEEETEEEEEDENEVESEETILEIDEFANQCYIIYGFYCNCDHQFEPPTEVFYDREEAEKEFLNYHVSSILSASQEYLPINSTVRSMIEVKQKETVITMYEYRRSLGGHEFPDKGYRYILRFLNKGEDY